MKFLGLIAAAGKSSRMGHHKALIRVYGKELLSLALEKMAALCPHQLIVTLPPELITESIVQMSSLSRARVTANLYPKMGYTGSIKTALNFAHKTIDGVLIYPIDVPLFSHKLLHVMRHCFHIYENKPQIIIPYYFYRPGHPIFFSKHFFYDLKESYRENGPRTVALNNRTLIKALFWPGEYILCNLNAPNDLQNLPLKWAAQQQ